VIPFVISAISRKEIQFLIRSLERGVSRLQRKPRPSTARNAAATVAAETASNAAAETASNAATKTTVIAAAKTVVQTEMTAASLTDFLGAKDSALPIFISFDEEQFSVLVKGGVNAVVKQRWRAPLRDWLRIPGRQEEAPVALGKTVAVKRGATEEVHVARYLDRHRGVDSGGGVGENVAYRLRHKPPTVPGKRYSEQHVPAEGVNLAVNGSVDGVKTGSGKAKGRDNGSGGCGGGGCGGCGCSG